MTNNNVTLHVSERLDIRHAFINRRVRLEDPVAVAKAAPSRLRYGVITSRDAPMSPDRK